MSGTPPGPGTPPPGAAPPPVQQPGAVQPPAQAAPVGAPAVAPGGLSGIVASSAAYAQAQVANMVSQGIGVGGYPDINYYDWVTGTDQEHRHNPQAGENLLWILPQRATDPQLGRPEASHWMNHMSRSFRCVASMFPELQMRCPICDALQQIAHLPGVDVNRMGAQWRYNLCVVDYKHPENHVQVVTISDRLFMQIYQTLANADLPEQDRDFTNPLHGRPWQITRTQTRKKKIKYSAQLYPITPMPMARKPDGTPDSEMIQYWIDSCPKLWEIIKEPNDEMMTEIATVAYDLINYWTNRPQAGQPIGGAVGMPVQTQVPPVGMPVGGQPVMAPPGAPGVVPGAPPPAPSATAPLPPGTMPPGPIPPQAVAAPPPAGAPAPAAPGVYNPAFVPPTMPGTPAAPAQGTPGYIPPTPTAPVAPGGTLPPGMGDQSPPPPPAAMPGQPPAPAASAPPTGRMACFGTGQYSADRLMCAEQCKDKTECAETQPPPPVTG